MKTIIAISGLKNSGKDLTAHMIRYCLSVPKWMRQYWLYCLVYDFIVSKYEITSFASSMKEALSVLINVPVEKFNDRDFKENWYINLQSIHITAFPDNNLMITDKQLSRMIKSKKSNVISNYYISIRQLLQIFGTEIIREYFGNNFWVLRTLLDKDNIIISDLRFINEYEQVKNNNGIVIYIDRNQIPGSHRSESEVIELFQNNKFDYIINNDGSIENLFNKVSDLASKILK